MSTEVRRVVIAGGGTAGWIAAAALSRQLGSLLEITLIESEQIGIVGVGESTVPPMRVFNKLLGIDEQEFMRACAATFKLGIWFENWRKPGDRYIHPFGRHGKPTWLCEFHHFWLRARELGFSAPLGEYCCEWAAANAGKFATSPQSEINFAYHIDAALYARFLRGLAERKGVRRIEGKISEVRKAADTGYIESLVLESGTVVAGDFFIDCTGFRGLLIEQALHTGFEDWSHWLPCDRAVAVQAESLKPPDPYTSAIAHEAGWRWVIPLQHRVGSGVVYCSRYMSDETARDKLVLSIQDKAIRPPFFLRFQPGRRRRAWNRNCVAFGLASGFIEPLESTSIHMIVSGVTRFMQLFPFDGVRQSLVDRYNEEARAEIEHIRDFVVLHYHATERDDTPFWRHCRSMEIPDSLARRMRLFQEAAHAWQADGELFRVDSWVAVMLGQGIVPKHYHPAARTLSDAELGNVMNSLRAQVSRTVAELPSHDAFVREYCRANSDVWERR